MWFWRERKSLVLMDVVQFNLSGIGVEKPFSHPS